MVTVPTSSPATAFAWPPDPSTLAVLIRRGEADLVDFKREWHDLTDKVSRAKFVKHVLALANTATPERPGLLLYGIDDPRHGGGLVGVPAHPPADAITDALKLLTEPMVDVRYVAVTVQGASIGVLAVLRSKFHPHWATRDVDGALSTTAFYVRKGASVAVALPAEVEAFFREKDARLGGAPAAAATHPLEVGFVEGGGWSSTPNAVLRVVNVSEEPVPSVDVIVDVRLLLHPDVFCRTRRWSAAHLGPGESKEVEIRVEPDKMYRGPQYVSNALGTLHYRWADLTAHVLYRDRAGFLQRLTREHVLID
jgi:hypothetical protein